MRCFSLLVFLSMALATGCGSTRRTAALPAAPALLPAPAAFRQAATIGTTTVLGAEFLPGSNLAGAQGDTAALAPAFDGAALDGAAWAVYRFDIGVGSGVDQLQLRWQTPPATGTLWIALADQYADRWDWYQPADPAGLQFTMTGNYAAADGSALVAVVLLGTAPAQLAALRLGDDAAPVARLSATPPGGATPLSVGLDATASFSFSGAIAHYAWDLDGDGTYEVDGGGLGTLDHVLDAPVGTYTVGVQVTDDSALSAAATVSVAISSVPYVEPESELFIDEVPGDDPGANWLGNCYKPLPEWRDMDRCFQNMWFTNEANELRRLLNEFRAANSVGPLELSPHFELVAQAHARNMALNNFMDYFDQYGLGPFDRVPLVGPTNSSVEVIGSISTAQGMLDGMLADDMIRGLLLGPELNYAGLGFYKGSGGYRWGVSLTSSIGSPDELDWLDPDEVP